MARRSASSAREAAYTQANKEMDRWQAERRGTPWRSTRTPDPRQKRGLPPGWVPVAHLTGYMSDIDLHLVQRRAGGWLIVQRHVSSRQSVLFAADASLPALYDGLIERQPQYSTPPWSRVIDWLRDLLIDYFDSEDPVEEAERMLFALGGCFTVIPRRLADL